MMKMFKFILVLFFLSSCSSVKKVQKSSKKELKTPPSLYSDDKEEISLENQQDREEGDQDLEEDFEDNESDEESLLSDNQELKELLEEDQKILSQNSENKTSNTEETLNFEKEQLGKDEQLDEILLEEEQSELSKKQNDKGLDLEDDLEDLEVEPPFTEEKREENKISEDSSTDLDNLEDSQEEIASQTIRVKAIRFFAHKSQGTVVVDTSTPVDPESSFNQETKQFIVKIKQAILDKSVERPLITKEFRGPISAIQAYQKGNEVRIVVQMKDSISPFLQTEGTSFLIIPSSSSETLAGEDLTDTESSTIEKEISQIEKEEKARRGSNLENEIVETFTTDTNDKKARDLILSANSLEDFLLGKIKFYGRPISIETKKDTDIRTIIEFISEEVSLNLIFSSDVKGQAQLKLKNVPWDQVLITLLRNNKLGYIRQGNVIRIDTLENLKSEAKNLKEILETKKSLDPITLRVLAVNFAKASDIAGHVQGFLTPKRGKVVTDNETNSLIVHDTEEVVAKIQKLLLELDQAPPQVMIEAKVIEASENFSNKLGVNWRASGVSYQLSEDGGYKGRPITLSSFLDLNLAGNNAGANQLRLKLGTLDFLGNLDARLFIEEEKDNVKVIAAPRILAMNKVASTITQSGQVFSRKVTTDTEGKTESTFIPRNFSLNMSVTPQVSADGSVIMDLNITRSFPGAEVNGESPINTRSAKTKAIVRSGETAVIGGIYQDDETFKVSGVPVLQNIPLVGWLFKSQQKIKVKTELLLFLKPEIVPYKKKNLTAKF